MIKYLISLVLLAVSGSALADYPAVFLRAQWNNSGGLYTYYPTPLEACQMWNAKIGLESGHIEERFTLTGPDNLATSYKCEFIYTNGTSGGPISPKNIQFHCPYQPAAFGSGSSTNVGGTCVGTGKPPASCPTPSGEAIVWTIKTGTGGLNDTSATTPSVSFATYPTTSPLCGLSARPVLKSCQSYDVGTVRQFTCTFTGISNGTVAPTADAAPNVGPGGGEATPGTTQPKSVMPPVPVPAGDSKCPSGTVSGGIDSAGRTVCIGTGVDPKNPPPVTPTVISKAPVTTTNPDGSTTVLKETQVTNADGSVTTTKETTTTDAAGNVTKGGTSSTSNNSSGGAGQADSQAEKESFCKQNPQLAVCKNSSVTGTCAAVACEGDAIQCATLRAIATMECREKKNEDDIAALPSTSLGNSILSGADPMKGQIDSAIAGTTVNMSSSLDQGGFLARSCFGNKSFTVAGRVITIEFASLCNGIEPLKYIILSCAMLAAYLIVAKSVLGT